MSSINDLNINQIVTFQSKLPSDQNTYHGKVISMMTWEEAIKHGDIVAYNNNLINTLGSSVYNIDYKDVTYFLLERYSYADNQPIDKVIFAKEWIDEATFTIEGVYRKLTLVVFGVPDANIIDVTNAIKSLGYVSVVTNIE